MSPSITFYDIPSKAPINAWSPNTWKTRYSLNYKGIAYETVWVEYPDIEAVCKEIGAEPTTLKSDGSPYYTLPVIKDNATGVVVADSMKIAAYLDATYPETPALFPAGTRALQHAFQSAYFGTLGAWFAIGASGSNSILRPRGEEYFRRTREADYGVRLEELSPAGSEVRTSGMKQVKAGFDTVDGWLQQSEGAYVMGDTVSFADITIASWVGWFKLVVPEEWEAISTWHGGRWAKILDNMEKYAAVV
ncbi:hypothetical protein PLICRDRAFT_631738 [Plicaturopsis crispa FD-325 SS-3]|nr:hypothetical protein PLICRDRAFT_631738 [Plicaturopsis crispa FD-325 SS-3]